MLDLNKSISQEDFANLVGVSQQAISSQAVAGVLEVGGTARSWLYAYCERLRQQAAGRAGDGHVALTSARTREAEASANLKELQTLKAAGELVPISEIEPLLAAMVTAARQELLSLPEKIAGEIFAIYEVQIDPCLVEAKIHDALNHLAGGFPGAEADEGL